MMVVAESLVNFAFQLVHKNPRIARALRILSNEVQPVVTKLFTARFCPSLPSVAAFLLSCFICIDAN